MKILVTGNPNYDGLASGIYEVFCKSDLEFISRSNGWNLFDHETIAEYAKNFDVFINNSYVPNFGQVNILKSVYSKFNNGHIINISSTVVYWNNLKQIDYYQEKLELEKLSKKLSSDSVSKGIVKVSCIAFGELDTERQRSRNDNRNKMNVIKAASVIKNIIDNDYNISYMNLDPIQKET